MNINNLIECLKIQTVSNNTERMEQYIFEQVEQINGAVYEYDAKNRNIYVTKGNGGLFPCIVAHTDTVHGICDTFDIVNVKGNLTGYNYVTMEQAGIGGDDKVGVFIALEMLRKYDDIKVAFFSDEEIGCVGSYCADLSFFSNCSFVLQFDRRGNSDLVSHASGTELSSAQFRKDVAPIGAKYGYKFTTGMMTDVMALREIGLQISCMNISCGYYRPHCTDEYVNIADVHNAYDLCCDIIDRLSSKQYKADKIGKRYKYKYTPTKLWEVDSFANSSNTNQSKKLDAKICECCTNVTADVQYHSYFRIDMCGECREWVAEEL